MSAALGEMFTLPEQLLPEVACHHRSTVTIHPVDEVLAGEADPGSLPVAELTVIDVIPLFHRLPECSTVVLVARRGLGQVFSERFLISERHRLLQG